MADPTTVGPSELSDLLSALNAGGNVALIVCVIYINNAVKVLARLEKGVEALLYRIGFQIDEHGKVTPIRRTLGE